MSIVDSIILGVVQGFTEFLPISSTGHLIITEKLLGLKVESLKFFDLALHIGTLLAVFFYFKMEIVNEFKEFFMFLKKKEGIKFFDLKLVKVGFAMMPAVLIGFFAGDWIDSVFRNGFMVAINLIIVGILFVVVEKLMGKKERTDKISFFKSFIIGFGQSLALIPGISRSGSTILTGIMLGIKRDVAAKYSFLLGFFTTSAAVIYETFKFLKNGGNEVKVGFLEAGIGVLVSTLVGFWTIKVLMNFLKNHTLVGFGIYRIIFGLLLIGLFFYNFV